MTARNTNSGAPFHPSVSGSRYGDLIAASAMAVVCAAVISMVPVPAVRVPFAVPLCLFLPGYAVMAAAFAGVSLGAPQRALLIPGLSLSVLALGSLVLQLVPGGLRSGSWLTLLVGIIVLACIVAAIRRASRVIARPAIRFPRPRATESVVLGLGVAAAAAAFGLARTPIPARNVIGYSQLWMLPAATARETGVDVGVTSGETHLTHYRLDVSVGSGRAGPSLRFALGPGERLERFVAIPTPPGGTSGHATMRVTGLLYRQSRPKVVYRRVFVWLKSRR